MRESADDAQRILNQATDRLGELPTEGTHEFGDAHRGTVETVDNIEDLRELASKALRTPAAEIARNIDTEIMDEVYSSTRNNADRVNDGYNEIRGLMAVDNGIDPKMITGAKPGTVDDWYEDFRKAGLTYPGESGEETTTEGELFVNEYENFLQSQGLDPDDREAQNFLADVVGSLSRRSSAQKVTPLEGFLYAAEEDPSAAEIADSVGVTKRTVYNWMEKWNGDKEDGLGLITGDPRDRRLTDRGLAAYRMIDNQYSALDISSEMKARMIEELEEDHSDGELRPFIPGNRRMVADYLENPELADEYMRQD